MVPGAPAAAGRGSATGSGLAQADRAQSKLYQTACQRATFDVIGPMSQQFQQLHVRGFVAFEVRRWQANDHRGKSFVRGAADLACDTGLAIPS